MKNTIRVVLVEAGNNEIKVINSWEDSLDNLQRFVGGYVQAIRVNSSITLWINEEGKQMGLEPNFYLVKEDGKPYDMVVGNVLIAGTDDEGDSASLTDEEIQELQERFLNRGTFKL